MKKLISVVLLLAMVLGLFAGCGKDKEASAGLQSAAEYLTSMYQTAGKDEAIIITADLDVLSSVVIDGVSYGVEWTVAVTQGAADSVTVAESKQDNHVKLDIPLHSGEDILFTATATVSDAEGNSLDAVFNYMVEGVVLAGAGMTMEELDPQSFEGAVDAIVSARKIYLIGVRSSASLTMFLHFYFNLIFDNVVMVSANTASEIFESLLRVGEEDVVLGVSFPRYSSRTVQAMSFARDRGATTISITDSEASPLAAISKYTLKARSDMASFVDSLVAPLSLVNALLVAVSRKKNDDLAHTFQTLEEIWEEYGVYEKVQE